jgi:hypothetical protein
MNLNTKSHEMADQWYRTANDYDASRSLSDLKGKEAAGRPNHFRIQVREAKYAKYTDVVRHYCRLLRLAVGCGRLP